MLHLFKNIKDLGELRYSLKLLETIKVMYFDNLCTLSMSKFTQL